MKTNKDPKGLITQDFINDICLTDTLDKNETIKIRPVLLERKKETFISSDKPVMVCSNAMNESHKCVFCKCYECYIRELRTEERDNNAITNKSRKGNSKRPRSKK